MLKILEQREYTDCPVNFKTHTKSLNFKKRMDNPEIKQVRIDLYFTYVGQIRIPLKIGRESLNESEPAC